MTDPQNNRNLLSADVEIKGSIKFTNELTIDGKVEGEITSSGTLTVGENAEIHGEIKTKSVTVHGKVHRQHHRRRALRAEGPRCAARAI